MYRIKRFSVSCLEQREFNRRTKLKRKLDAATHNAEMQSNKAIKAEAKASKIMETATTPKEAKKALALLDKAEKAQKSSLNNSKRVKDSFRALEKQSPNSLNKQGGALMNSGSKVKNTRRGIVRYDSNISTGTAVNDSSVRKIEKGIVKGESSIKGIDKLKESKSIAKNLLDTSSKSSKNKLLKNKKALAIASLAGLGLGTVAVLKNKK